MKQEKAARLEREAARFGLSVEDYRALRKQLQAADTSDRATKAIRLSLAARRLGITPSELTLLRRALDGGSPVALAQRSAARQISAMPPLQRTLDAPKKTKRADPERARGVIVPLGGRTLFRTWGGDTSVFLTQAGNAIHLRSDCHGMRGFRASREPDPKVHQVRLRDPACAERKACLKCFDIWSKETIRKLDDLIENLHGGPRSRKPARRQRPRASTVVISRITPAKNAPGHPTKAEAKRDRRNKESARLGISPEELKARRRAKAEDNRRKKLGQREGNDAL